jgi:RHS repeat-associated protein
VHNDHLGSPELFTRSDGTELLRVSFGAYGERRDGSDWSGAPSAGDMTTLAGITRRGFTGHEHLDAVGLIHMNGRVYDPAAGRFLGADPIVEVGNSQSPNSYSYVWNNPLTMVDPSGFAGREATQPATEPVTRNFGNCNVELLGVQIDCLYWYGWRPLHNWKWWTYDRMVDLYVRRRLAEAYIANQQPNRKPLLARFKEGILDPINDFVTSPEVVEFSAGFGDVALAIVTLGNADGVEYRAVKGIGSVDPTSTAYEVGYWTGVFASAGVARAFFRPPTGRGLPKSPKNWLPPTNPPQLPPSTLPPGHTVRVMGPTKDYPNGYWRQYDQRGNPVNPATGEQPGSVTRAEAAAQTHVPLPPRPGS